jgi:hypothetical protein
MTLRTALAAYCIDADWNSVAPAGTPKMPDEPPRVQPFRINPSTERDQ